MGVKCLAQEHNVVPRPGLEPRPFDPESSALTTRPLRLPLEENDGWKIIVPQISKHMVTGIFYEN